MSRSFDVDTFERYVERVSEELQLQRLVTKTVDSSLRENKRRLNFQKVWELTPRQYDIIDRSVTEPNHRLDAAIESFISRDPRIEKCIVSGYQYIALHRAQCRLSFNISLCINPEMALTK